MVVGKLFADMRVIDRPLSGDGSACISLACWRQRISFGTGDLRRGGVAWRPRHRWVVDLRTKQMEGPLALLQSRCRSSTVRHAAHGDYLFTACSGDWCRLSRTDGQAVQAIACHLV